MIIVKLVEHNEAFFDAIDEDDDEVAEALKAHYAMMERLKEEGKFLGGYYLPGEDRSIQVFNFENEAEADKNFLEDPMSRIFDAEYHVGLPILEHIKRVLDIVPDSE